MIKSTPFYSYKGNEYAVLGAGRMKNPETGEWQACMIYRDAEGRGSLHTYIREMEDFHSKFTFTRQETIEVLNGGPTDDR